MKSGLKVFSGAFLIMLFAAAATTFSANAQNRERFTISAKAGGVNAVLGNVMVVHKDETTQPLTSQDNLDSGDIVKTGAGGRVELLLNPGSYLRLAENSELHLQDLSLEHLELQLSSGSAILETTGSHDLALQTRINTPQTSVEIADAGVYRFNALPSGATEILVHKGQAVVTKPVDRVVKDGRKAVITGGNLELVKLNKSETDDLDIWSKSRAEMLASANKHLSDDNMSSALGSYSYSAPLGFGSYAYPFGFWAYNPFYSYSTFFPFYSGWGSPYGFGYANGFGVPWYYYGYAPVIIRVNPPKGQVGTPKTIVIGPHTSSALAAAGNGRTYYKGGLVTASSVRPRSASSVGNGGGFSHGGGYHPTIRTSTSGGRHR